MASLEDQVKTAEAEAEAAEALVSAPAFTARAELRKRLAAAEERKAAARSAAREDKIADRLAFVRDALGADGGEIENVSINALPHDFIVRAAGAAAYKAWSQGSLDARMEKIQKGTRNKVDGDDVARKYAVAGILMWNDHVMDDAIGEVDTERGKGLHDFLRANPAVVSEIVGSILRLDGAASEARKS